MKRRLLTSLALPALFVAMTAVSTATAESPVLSRIVKSGELRVGMTGDMPPLNAKNREGSFIGLEPDLVRLLAGSLGVEPKITQMAFSELLPALAAGKIDMIMSGMTITLERNMNAAFVGPYFVSGKSILTKSKTLAEIDEASDIDRPDVKLAALEGSTSQAFVEALIPNATLTKAANYDEAVKLVLDDKVNALVADFPICVLSVLRHEGLATLGSPLTIEPIGIAVPPNDPLLVNLLQNYLGALQSTGALDALQQRWLEDGSWLAQLP